MEEIFAPCYSYPLNNNNKIPVHISGRGNKYTLL